VSIATGTTATYSSFNCVQTNPSRIDCTIQIDSSGDLEIDADDVAGNSANESEDNYIVDTVAPILSLVTASPETIEYLAAYIDGGAIYTDNVDGTGALV
jgi:hypothetical protein